ncbi:nuclear transport factor 2 family protein [Arenibacter sp. BSSL-BM3]|uniref:Nuclear transport factor 2 family protein n=1 Tax=Arenibacter arenosicollis TaxID=2762274 RepID=A0ABR7QQR0_9FLAO|nr:nuclear transport factor 2 family protein [Arenibacter arenosicollis]MBC8769513.1 nuclear transport factor 2 family protein [Arenibacter arenosicollis]
MNKIWSIILFFMFASAMHAQNGGEELVKNTIDAFFKAFHEQDSMAIKETVSKNIVMQTIGKNAEGTEEVKTENFGHFLKSIVSIPSTTKFEERILNYNIQIDGSMANAWTTYEFWVNDGLSHCGVNSFQLFNQQGSWKIIYLIDTRRKVGCN